MRDHDRRRLSALTAVADGTITSPHNLARFFGLSRGEARTQPATAIFLAYRIYTEETLGATYRL